ncbi:BTAD domain-containing putative transcriptional regulator [soil metagenome]
MQVRLLGRLEVLDGERVLDIGGPKQRAVLAALAISAGAVVSLDRLIDQLWGDQPPARATGSLQAYISNLRRALEPDRRPRAPAKILVSQPPGYLLAVAPADLDVACFEALAADGSRLLAAGRPAAAHRALDEALALWRGPALADVASEPFAGAEIVRLEERRAVAVEARSEAALALGHHDLAVAELDRLVGEQPLRERRWALLILALYRSGRQGEALRAYQRARTTLGDELGVDPGPDLQRLERLVLDQDPSLEWQPPPPEHEPVPAATAPTRPTAPPAATGDADRPGTSPLIGREAPLAQLQEAVAEAAGGQRQLRFVAGEPGIGKTRLAEEVAGLAGTGGATVCWARCYEGTGAPPSWLWVQVLRSLLTGRSAAEIDELLGRARGDLAQLLPELSDPSGSAGRATDPDTARFQLRDSVSEVLARAAGERPLVVVLDDLHWADATTLGLLQFVASDPRPARLCIIGTYRDVDVVAGDPLDEVLTALAREPSVRRLTLDGLGVAEVGRYLAAVTGTEPAPVVAAAMHDRTEGNPFFLTELVRLLTSEGRLVLGAAGDVGPEVPDEVRDVVRRRLDRLPPDTQAVLTVAALISDDFGLELLERACAIASDRLLDLIEVALVTRIITERPGARGRYRFTHALVREALVDGLSTVQRARLHARVAAAIETLVSPDLDAHLAVLAHHYGEGAAAGVADRAEAFAVRAARQSGERLAHEQAAEHWEQALAALELHRPGDRVARYEILMGLVQARRCSGDVVASRAALDAAIEVVVRMDDPERLARAAVSFGLGSAWIWRSYGEVDHDAVALLERALRVLGEHDSNLKCEVLGTLGVELYYGKQRDRSAALSDEAVAMARRLGEPTVLADALNMHYMAKQWPDPPEERLAVAEEMTDLPAKGALPEVGLVGRLYRMVSRLELGEIEAADAELEPCRRVAAELRQPALIAQLAWYRAMRSLLAGRFDEAEQLSLEAFGLHQHTSLWGGLECFGTQLFTLRRGQGRIGELEPILSELVANSEFSTFREGAALMYLDLGRDDEARAVLAAGGGPPDPDRPKDWSWLFVSCVHAELCADLGDRAWADRLYAALTPSAERVAVIGTGMCCWGSVAYFLGRLAALLDRPAEAAHHFEVALVVNERLGARPWLARTRYSYGQLLLEGGTSGDRDATRAAALLAEAAATAEELGMAMLGPAVEAHRDAARSASPR